MSQNQNEQWIDLSCEKAIGFAFSGARGSARDIMPDVPAGGAPAST